MSEIITGKEIEDEIHRKAYSPECENEEMVCLERRYMDLDLLREKVDNLKEDINYTFSKRSNHRKMVIVLIDKWLSDLK